MSCPCFIICIPIAISCPRVILGLLLIEIAASFALDNCPLSLLGRVHAETKVLAVLVTCQLDEKYHGFVLITDLQKDDLNKVSMYKKRPMRTKNVGYD